LVESEQLGRRCRHIQDHGRADRCTVHPTDYASQQLGVWRHDEIHWQIVRNHARQQLGNLWFGTWTQ
jgi:hypothetical protein